MEVQDVVALMIVGGAVYYVTRSLWRTLGSSKGSTCHCPQNQSKDEANREQQTNPRHLKRTPFIPVDQIGIPDSKQPEAEKIDK